MRSRFKKNLKNRRGGWGGVSFGMIDEDSLQKLRHAIRRYCRDWMNGNDGFLPRRKPGRRGVAA